MSQQDQSKPYLVGGLIMGVLSVIPLVNAGNTCCCLWAWIGGAVAAKLLVDGSPQPVTISDGAKIGMYAGLLGAFIRIFIGLPVELVTLPYQLRVLGNFARQLNNPQLEKFVEDMVDQMSGRGMGGQIIGMLPGTLIGAAVLLGFTVLGGMVGVKLFEKRQNQFPPQAPPPQWNPPQSGSQSGDDGGWPQQ